MEPRDCMCLTQEAGQPEEEPNPVHRIRTQLMLGKTWLGEVYEVPCKEAKASRVGAACDECECHGRE